MTKSFISLFALFLMFANSVMAGQDMKTAEEIRAEYKAKWHALVTDLDTRTDLTFVEKLKTYDREIISLKQQYIDARLNEYKGNEVTLTAEHQCKGRPAGSTRNCGYVCVERPSEDMYTQEEWVSFEGDYMDEIVNEEKACFELEAKGNVKKQGSVTATFRYRGSFVDYKTADDASELFSSFLENH